MTGVTTITLPLDPRIVWGCVTVLALAALCVLVVWIQPRAASKPAPLEKTMEKLGLTGLPPALFLIFALLLLGLLIVLTVGLYIILGDVILGAVPDKTNGTDLWEFRFKLVQLTALTTVLGATVALPLTMARLHLQRVGARTAEDTLFNHKITEAAADLYARRQKTIPRRGLKDQHAAYDVWEDDIVKRNAAIDRLEGLVKERPDVAARVSRLLRIYVRELSSEDEQPAIAAPKDAAPSELREWAAKLTARSDMENAVQTLGRLRSISGVERDAVKIDLQGANLQAIRFEGGDYRDAFMNRAQLQGAHLFGAQLQGADLSWAQLQGADLIEAQLQGANLSWAQLHGAHLFRAQLQGANLSWAQLQGANLSGAQLQGAHLIEAQLQGAHLSWAQLQGANLIEAQLKGADLSWARMDPRTSLTAATLRGAAVREVDDTTLSQMEPFWQDIYADESSKVPEDKRPTHWDTQKLDWDDFYNNWRAWQHSIGQNPEDPQ